MLRTIKEDVAPLYNNLAFVYVDNPDYLTLRSDLSIKSKKLPSVAIVGARHGMVYPWKEKTELSKENLVAYC